MTVLVTGGTGFIGSHLVAALAREGAPVRALVRPGSDAAALAAAGVEVVRGDILDPASLAPAMRGCRAVYHAAALTSRDRAPARTLYAVNVGGTGNVARAALDAGAERLVFCSTGKVFGVARPGPLDEHAPRAPATPYARSKAQAEDLLLDLGETRGLPVVVARLGGTFGPGAVGWLGLFRAIAGGGFRPPGACAGRYPAGDIDDTVAGLLRCGRTPGVEGRVYHLSGPRPVRLAELLAEIAAAVGADPLPLPGTDLPLRAWRVLQAVSMALTRRSLPRFSRVELFLADRALDGSRARRELGHEPRIDLRASIARTAAWFRDSGRLPAASGAGS